MTTSQKQAARKFVEYWTFQRGSEKGEDQQFWNSLLRDVLCVADVERHIKYQMPVQLKDTTKFLDAWIPETRVLIEHKSRGVSLDASQSGHGGLTPYEQAVEYDNARSFDEKARWIVTCNFDEFRIYDRAKPLAPPMKMGLGDLPNEAHRLAFLVNAKEKAIDRELEISVQAGRIVGEIYDALLKQYENGAKATGEHLAALNRLCVRLVFCLYAEDADIFPKDCFKRLVEASDARRLRIDLQRLFHTLDTPTGERDPYLEPELCAFPYTNGGLFRNAAANDIPPLTEEIRKLLIGASQFDWRGITPTIFGALFESTLNPVTRRAGGMVYTSVENIHKVIDPLFLDDLTRRVEVVIHNYDKRTLLALQTEMAALTFLDPACGSGNFLTETYICLRRLENRIIAALQKGQREFDLGLSVKVSIAQFHGIEINDFAVAVAKTALWIAEAQMLRETAEILHREPDYLPLHDYANIVEGNALRMDWSWIGMPPPNVSIVAVNGNILFQDAKARLTELKSGNAEVVNAAGDRFRFTKQVFKALSDKARDQSVARSVHWAAVAAVDRLCEASTFLWDEKPRNGSVDIDRYAKHGACFKVDNDVFVAKITSKVYPGDAAHVTYSVEAVSIEKNDARGMTDSIARGQSLDPSARGRILKFSEAVKGAFAKNRFSYIMGNPPFSGARWMGKDQKDDMLAVFGKGWQGVGDLDYVTAWYKKAVDLVFATKVAENTKVAFVSTNSICQGGSVINLWKPLFSQGLEIDFAHRTFRWDNESFEKAHVHCVIVGFHVGKSPADGKAKTIFDNGKAILAAHINGYLMDAQDVWIESRTKPICDVPEIGIGNKPIDGGNYLFSKEEKDAFLKKEPQAAQFFHPWYGAEEFINGKVRFCLWLGDCTQAELFNLPECLKRVQAVRDYRLSSKSEGTRKIADKPTRFHVENFPKGNYIVIPEVSSEKRPYVPIGYLSHGVICSNKLRLMPDASLYHFGILNSRVHNAWVRAVCGRLETRYDYSINIVYNNFPWPDLCGSATLREKIGITAQSILDAREKYHGVTLAQMYGDKMYLFPELVAAHAANDRAVLAAYGLKPDTTEPEIVAHLFKLYAEKTAS